ncbi:efflux RND transporter periplasmic adaptor subunit [Microbulbifer sp. 2304DJ12-6]|uniref:efflux RND transporter periplasmic adaptor subunit n=1 Tax=Microbulbifer sp. 2304DJ12-6 TaxID=3233340 RepID=UPI0039AF54BC
MGDESKYKIAQLSLPKDDSFYRSTNKPLMVLVIVMVLGFSSYFYFDKTQQQAALMAAGSHQRAASIAGVASQQGRSATLEVSGAGPAAQTGRGPIGSNAYKQNGKVLDASGHIIARRVATVSSRVTSKVEKLLIEEGQVVEANDVLAELDSRQAKFNLARAEADLQAGKASLAELYSQLKLAEIQLERIERLFASRAVSQEDLDTERLLVAQLKAQIDNRKALDQKAAQQVNLESYNVDQHTIRAPFAGMVIQKNAQVGELISAGMSGGGSIRTGIATIVDMSSLEIEVDVAENYINRVFPGQPAVAHLDAYPDWTIKSEVLTIIPTANRQKATIMVRIKLLEIDERILPDMAVKVSFLTDEQS